MIFGKINNVLFSGTPFINDPQNQYDIYYPAGTLSSPYTVFYKEGKRPNAVQAFQQVIVFEFTPFYINYDLASEDIYWEREFFTSYDLASMNILKRRDGLLTSYTVGIRVKSSS